MPHEATCVLPPSSTLAPVFVHDCIVAAVLRAMRLARESAVTFTTTLAQATNSEAAVQVLVDSGDFETMVEGAVCNALRSLPRGSQLELDVQVRDDVVVLHIGGRGLPARRWSHRGLGDGAGGFEIELRRWPSEGAVSR